MKECAAGRFSLRVGSGSTEVTAFVGTTSWRESGDRRIRSQGVRVPCAAIRGVVGIPRLEERRLERFAWSRRCLITGESLV